MSLEIERKFFVKDDENLQRLIKSLPYNLEKRYYLYRKDGIEIRFTKIEKSSGEIIFLLDRMQLSNDETNDAIVRTKERIKITEDEFLKLLSILKTINPQEPIIRKSYTVSVAPQIEVKVYGGRFTGLIRAEIEFETVESSNSFDKPVWFGKEISNINVGIDTLLPDLTDQEFKDILLDLNS